MKKSFKISAAIFTLTTFVFTQFNTVPNAYAAAQMPISEIQVGTAGNIALPSNLGTIEALNLQGQGPMIAHIQTAHGNFEAQKNIQGILEFLKDKHGFNTLLLEGSAYPLNPEIIRLFPDDMKLTHAIAEDLTRKALFKGADLFMIDNPKVKALGIEDVDLYRENGNAFRAVLRQEAATENFVRDMNIQIERLTSPYMNKDLRAFLNRLDAYESKQVQFQDWVNTLKAEASKQLALDLEDPANQLEWPMLLRLFTLMKFEAKLDPAALDKEKAAFLKAIHRLPNNVYVQIEKLLTQPVNRNQLPSPETELLFEKMVESVPANFNYKAFPNVSLFIGHLILQSEIEALPLMNEVSSLEDKIAERLAITKEEKQILGLLKDHRLLKRLFALQLTPNDYEEVLARGTDMKPAQVVARFEKLNTSKRVKNVKFTNIEKINELHVKALEFYRLVKARDLAMLKNVPARMKTAGVEKAVVITGGFHAEPFREFAQAKGFQYALISPKITTDEGHDAYVRTVLATELKELTRSTYESVFVGVGSPELLRNQGVNPEVVVRAVAASVKGMKVPANRFAGTRFAQVLSGRKVSITDSSTAMVELAPGVTATVGKLTPSTSSAVASSRSEVRSLQSGDEYLDLTGWTETELLAKLRGLHSERERLEREYDNANRLPAGPVFLYQVFTGASEAKEIRGELASVNGEIRTFNRMLDLMRSRSEVRATKKTAFWFGVSAAALAVGIGFLAIDGLRRPSPKDRVVDKKEEPADAKLPAKQNSIILGNAEFPGAVAIYQEGENVVIVDPKIPSASAVITPVNPPGGKITHSTIGPARLIGEKPFREIETIAQIGASVPKSNDKIQVIYHPILKGGYTTLQQLRADGKDVNGAINVVSNSFGFQHAFGITATYPDKEAVLKANPGAKIRYEGSILETGARVLVLDMRVSFKLFVAPPVGSGSDEMLEVNTDPNESGQDRAGNLRMVVSAGKKETTFEFLAPRPGQRPTAPTMTYFLNGNSVSAFSLTAAVRPRSEVRNAEARGKVFVNGEGSGLEVPLKEGEQTISEVLETLFPNQDILSKVKSVEVIGGGKDVPVYGDLSKTTVDLAHRGLRLQTLQPKDILAGLEMVRDSFDKTIKAPEMSPLRIGIRNLKRPKPSETDINSAARLLHRLRIEHRVIDNAFTKMINNSSVTQPQTPDVSFVSSVNRSEVRTAESPSPDEDLANNNNALWLKLMQDKVLGRLPNGLSIEQVQINLKDPTTMENFLKFLKTGADEKSLSSVFERVFKAFDKGKMYTAEYDFPSLVLLYKNGPEPTLVDVPAITIYNHETRQYLFMFLSPKPVMDPSEFLMEYLTLAVTRGLLKSVRYNGDQSILADYSIKDFSLGFDEEKGGLHAYILPARSEARALSFDRDLKNNVVFINGNIAVYLAKPLPDNLNQVRVIVDEEGQPRQEHTLDLQGKNDFEISSASTKVEFRKRTLRDATMSFTAPPSTHIFREEVFLKDENSPNFPEGAFPIVLEAGKSIQIKDMNVSISGIDAQRGSVRLNFKYPEGKWWMMTPEFFHTRKRIGATLLPPGSGSTKIHEFALNATKGGRLYLGTAPVKLNLNSIQAQITVTNIDPVAGSVSLNLHTQEDNPYQVLASPRSETRAGHNILLSPVTDLTKKWKPSAKSIFEELQILTVAQLVQYTMTDLSGTNSSKRDGLKQIKAALDKHGLKLKDVVSDTRRIPSSYRMSSMFYRGYPFSLSDDTKEKIIQKTTEAYGGIEPEVSDFLSFSWADFYYLNPEELKAFQRGLAEQGEALGYLGHNLRTHKAQIQLNRKQGVVLDAKGPNSMRIMVGTMKLKSPRKPTAVTLWVKEGDQDWESVDLQLNEKRKIGNRSVDLVWLTSENQVALEFGGEINSIDWETEYKLSRLNEPPVRRSEARADQDAFLEVINKVDAVGRSWNVKVSREQSEISLDDLKVAAAKLFLNVTGKNVLSIARTPHLGKTAPIQNQGNVSLAAGDLLTISLDSPANLQPRSELRTLFAEFKANEKIAIWVGVAWIVSVLIKLGFDAAMYAWHKISPVSYNFYWYGDNFDRLVSKLSQESKEGVASELVSKIQGENPFERLVAYAALVIRGEKQYAPALLNSLFHDTEQDSLQQRKAFEIFDQYSGFAKDKIFDLISKVLEGDPEGAVRSQAMKILQREGFFHHPREMTEKKASVVIGRLSDASPDVRVPALEISRYGKLNVPETVLLDNLQNSSAKVRVEAAKTVAELMSRDAATIALKKALLQPGISNLEKIEFVKVLANLGDKSEADLLAEIIESDYKNRDAAWAVLMRIGNASHLKAIAIGFQHPYITIRKEALQKMLELGVSPDLLAAAYFEILLLPHFRDSNITILTDAIQGLAGYQPKDSLTLIDYTASRRNYYETVLIAAARALELKASEPYDQFGTDVRYEVLSAVRNLAFAVKNDPEFLRKALAVLESFLAKVPHTYEHQTYDESDAYANWGHSGIVTTENLENPVYRQALDLKADIEKLLATRSETRSILFKVMDSQKVENALIQLAKRNATPAEIEAAVAAIKSEAKSAKDFFDPLQIVLTGVIEKAGDQTDTVNLNFSNQKGYLDKYFGEMVIAIKSLLERSEEARYQGIKGELKTIISDLFISVIAALKWDTLAVSKAGREVMSDVLDLTEKITAHALILNVNISFRKGYEKETAELRGVIQKLIASLRFLVSEELFDGDTNLRALEIAAQIENAFNFAQFDFSENLGADGLTFNLAVAKDFTIGTTDLFAAVAGFLGTKQANVQQVLHTDSKLETNPVPGYLTLTPGDRLTVSLKKSIAPRSEMRVDEALIPRHFTWRANRNWGTHANGIGMVQRKIAEGQLKDIFVFGKRISTADNPLAVSQLVDMIAESSKDKPTPEYSRIWLPGYKALFIEQTYSFSPAAVNFLIEESRKTKDLFNYLLSQRYNQRGLMPSQVTSETLTQINKLSAALYEIEKRAATQPFELTSNDREVIFKSLQLVNDKNLTTRSEVRMQAGDDPAVDVTVVYPKDTKWEKVLKANGVAHKSQIVLTRENEKIEIAAFKHHGEIYAKVGNAIYQLIKQKDGKFELNLNELNGVSNPALASFLKVPFSAETLNQFEVFLPTDDSRPGEKARLYIVSPGQQPFLRSKIALDENVRLAYQQELIGIIGDEETFDSQKIADLRANPAQLSRLLHLAATLGVFYNDDTDYLRIKMGILAELVKAFQGDPKQKLISSVFNLVYLSHTGMDWDKWLAEKAAILAAPTTATTGPAVKERKKAFFEIIDPARVPGGKVEDYEITGVRVLSADEVSGRKDPEAEEIGLAAIIAGRIGALPFAGGSATSVVKVLRGEIDKIKDEIIKKAQAEGVDPEKLVYSLNKMVHPALHVKTSTGEELNISILEYRVLALLGQSLKTPVTIVTSDTPFASESLGETAKLMVNKLDKLGLPAGQISKVTQRNGGLLDNQGNLVRFDDGTIAVAAENHLWAFNAWLQDKKSVIDHLKRTDGILLIGNGDNGENTHNPEIVGKILQARKTGRPLLTVAGGVKSQKDTKGGVYTEVTYRNIRTGETFTKLELREVNEFPTLIKDRPDLPQYDGIDFREEKKSNSPAYQKALALGAFIEKQMLDDKEQDRGGLFNPAFYGLDTYLGLSRIFNLPYDPEHPEKLVEALAGIDDQKWVDTLNEFSKRVPRTTVPDKGITNEVTGQTVKGKMFEQAVQNLIFVSALFDAPGQPAVEMDVVTIPLEKFLAYKGTSKDGVYDLVGVQATYQAAIASGKTVLPLGNGQKVVEIVPMDLKQIVWAIVDESIADAKSRSEVRGIGKGAAAVLVALGLGGAASLTPIHSPVNAQEKKIEDKEGIVRPAAFDPTKLLSLVDARVQSNELREMSHRWFRFTYDTSSGPVNGATITLPKALPKEFSLGFRGGEFNGQAAWPETITVTIEDKRGKSASVDVKGIKGPGDGLTGFQNFNFRLAAFKGVDPVTANTIFIQLDPAKNKNYGANGTVEVYTAGLAVELRRGTELRPDEKTKELTSLAKLKAEVTSAGLIDPQEDRFTFTYDQRTKTEPAIVGEIKVNGALPEDFTMAVGTAKVGGQWAWPQTLRVNFVDKNGNVRAFDLPEIIADVEKKDVLKIYGFNLDSEEHAPFDRKNVQRIQFIVDPARNGSYGANGNIFIRTGEGLIYPKTRSEVRQVSAKSEQRAPEIARPTLTVIQTFLAGILPLRLFDQFMSSGVATATAAVSFVLGRPVIAAETQSQDGNEDVIDSQLRSAGRITIGAQARESFIEAADLKSAQTATAETSGKVFLQYTAFENMARNPQALRLLLEGFKDVQAEHAVKLPVLAVVLPEGVLTENVEKTLLQTLAQKTAGVPVPQDREKLLAAVEFIPLKAGRSEVRIVNDATEKYEGAVSYLGAGEIVDLNTPAVFGFDLAQLSRRPSFYAGAAMVALSLNRLNKEIRGKNLTPQIRAQKLNEFVAKSLDNAVDRKGNVFILSLARIIQNFLAKRYIETMA